MWGCDFTFISTCANHPYMIFQSFGQFTDTVFLCGSAWVCVCLMFHPFNKGELLHPQHIKIYTCSVTCSIDTCCGKTYLLITSNDCGYWVLGREKLHLYGPSVRWQMLHLVLWFCHSQTHIHTHTHTCTRHAQHPCKHLYMHAALTFQITFFSCCF